MIGRPGWRASSSGELGALIARGLKDPRITGLVTVTGAKMSPDLKEATAYVSVHGDEKVRKETMAGLAAATGFLQREVRAHFEQQGFHVTRMD